MSPEPLPTAARPSPATTASGQIFRGLKHEWRIPHPLDAPVEFHLPPLIAHLLQRRGIGGAAEAAEFLTPSSTSFEDPALLPDMPLAIARLHQARDCRERVAVYGDFDADGVTGTAILYKAFRRFGLDVVPYIPHRVTEGHGLNRAAIQQLRDQQAQLIVTVDCGVTDLTAVSEARALGMDTIITDHHLTGDALPDAVAVINPRSRHSVYPFLELTGAGMALKLAQALLMALDGAAWAEGLMELAAVGTVTDMAPLVGENRYIVACGLQQMRRTQSPGLLALMRAARIDPSTVDTVGIGFGIGPRLNAAGRMDHAEIAYELLVTKDPARANRLTEELDGHNALRQRLTADTLEQARSLLSPAPLLAFVGSPSFNPGVSGLVAGKLAEELGVPAVVYSEEGGRILASCRSGPNFHWTNALKACEDLLQRYGGHSQAAGFACEPSVLGQLQLKLEAVAGEQLAGQVESTRSVDAEVTLRDLMGPTLPLLRKMEPFGMGNPSPLFITRGLLVERATTIGAEGQHVRLSLRADGAVWEAIAFKQPWQPGTQQVDAVYSLGVDRWNGVERLRLNIEDFAPSQ